MIRKFVSRHAFRQQKNTYCTKQIYLFRGLEYTHSDYKDAAKGRVIPSQMKITESNGGKFPQYHDKELVELFDLAENHHLNKTTPDGSPFTSWTRNSQIAEHFAGKKGIILQATVGKQIRHCFPSPDEWAEDEVLVYGPVDNVIVKEIGNDY